MLGGQATTSGVCAFDLTFGFERLINGYGLWGELVSELRAEYRSRGLNPNTCRYRNDSLAANPVVTDLVLSRMAKQSNVSVLRRTAVLSGTIQAGRVSLATSRGIITGQIAIDATEDGSLLSTLRVRHRAGRLKFDGENYVGSDPERCGIQDITQVACLQYYEGGVPSELLVDEPPNYRLHRRLFARSYPSDPNGSRDHPRGFAGYRATPDLTDGAYPYMGSEWEKVTRTALNFRNDHAITASYLINPSRRDFEDQQAAEKTLALIHFLQKECGQPWSVATDEGFAAVRRPRRFPDLRAFDAVLCHFPPKPYIRESLRGIGLTTLTAKDIFRMSNRGTARWNSDAIAVGTYPPDLHGGREESDLEPDLNESLSDKPATWREGPFAIPMGTLIHADYPNLLLAEKNISVSRIASGAVRLHPTVVAIGEAAGTLAAISVRKKIDTSDVPATAVQASLTRGGALPAQHAILGVSRDDEDFPDIALALARSVAISTPSRIESSEPVFEVNREISARIGRELMNSVRDFTVSPLAKHS